MPWMYNHNPHKNHHLPTTNNLPTHNPLNQNSKDKLISTSTPNPQPSSKANPTVSAGNHLPSNNLNNPNKPKTHSNDRHHI